MVYKVRNDSADRPRSRANSQRELDHVDRRLISLLKEDGRAPAASLAKAIGVSERTVRNRIKALRRDGIIRIAAITEPSAIGFTVVARVGVEVEPGSVRDIAQKLADHPLVSYVGFPIGGNTTIAVQVRCRNSQQLGELLNETFPSIPGVRNVTFQLVHRTIKDSIDWDIPAED